MPGRKHIAAQCLAKFQSPCNNNSCNFGLGPVAIERKGIGGEPSGGICKRNKRCGKLGIASMYSRCAVRFSVLPTSRSSLQQCVGILSVWLTLRHRSKCILARSAGAAGAAAVRRTRTRYPVQKIPLSCLTTPAAETKAKPEAKGEEREGSSRRRNPRPKVCLCVRGCVAMGVRG